MEPCKIPNCTSLYQKNQNYSSPTALKSTWPAEEETNTFLNIVLPVILVVGVFGVVGLGLVIHR